MALHADAGDRGALRLELLDHIVDVGPLRRGPGAVVIIEQTGVGISLVGPNERVLDELVAAELVSLRLAERILVRSIRVVCVAHGLIDDVPAVDDVLVTVDHGEDMGLERIVELLLAGSDILGGLDSLHDGSAATLGARTAEAAETAECRPLDPDGITLLVKLDDRVAVLVVFGEHPGGELAVPDKVVATHLDAVLAAEVCDGVGPLEIPYTGFGMDLAGLHAVLSGNAVELLEDEG